MRGLEMISQKGNNLFYLYGVHKATWLDMNYIEAFLLKNKLANKVLSEILDTDLMERDNARKMAVINAIRYNDRRINE